MLIDVTLRKVYWPILFKSLNTVDGARYTAQAICKYRTYPFS